MVASGIMSTYANRFSLLTPDSSLLVRRLEAREIRPAADCRHIDVRQILPPREILADDTPGVPWGREEVGLPHARPLAENPVGHGRQPAYLVKPQAYEETRATTHFALRPKIAATLLDDRPADGEP